MIILGIETSCDETAAAIVEETGDMARPWRIRSSVVASQVEIHREWGGVVPELSARQHIRDICGVVERALAEAASPAFDAIAVTQGPGLVGSLLVGVSFAKSLSWARSVPLVPVHHLAGHIESLVLENGEMPLPAVVLVVSGGHTSLYRIAHAGEYELLGRTRDDAAGEAYDKVAKLLGLGYPGGPVVDRLATQGNDRAIPFPKTRLTHADRNAPHLPGRRDFSFSGLKTSVLRHVTTHPPRAPRPTWPTSAPAFSALSSRRCSTGCSTPRAHPAHAAWASPAACRPTAACGRTRWRAARPAACPCSSPVSRFRPIMPR